MNGTERKLFGDLYEYLVRNSQALPSNPMDIRALVRGAQRTEAAVGVALSVVSSIGFGDYEDAREAIEAAVVKEEAREARWKREDKRRPAQESDGR